MGIWGHDVFANDTASDFVGHVVRFIKETIEQDLKQIQTKTGRAILERKTGPAIVTLAVLCKGIPKARYSIEPSDVNRWRITFLSWLDDYFVQHYDDRKQAVRLRAKFKKALDELKGLVEDDMLAKQLGKFAIDDGEPLSLVA